MPDTIKVQVTMEDLTMAMVLHDSERAGTCCPLAIVLRHKYPTAIVGTGLAYLSGRSTEKDVYCLSDAAVKYARAFVAGAEVRDFIEGPKELRTPQTFTLTKAEWSK